MVGPTPFVRADSAFGGCGRLATSRCSAMSAIVASAQSTWRVLTAPRHLRSALLPHRIGDTELVTMVEPLWSTEYRPGEAAVVRIVCLMDGFLFGGRSEVRRRGATDRRRRAAPEHRGRSRQAVASTFPTTCARPSLLVLLEGSTG